MRDCAEYAVTDIYWRASQERFRPKTYRLREGGTLEPVALSFNGATITVDGATLIMGNLPPVFVPGDGGYRLREDGGKRRREDD